MNLWSTRLISHCDLRLTVQDLLHRKSLEQRMGALKPVGLWVGVEKTRNLDSFV